MNQTQTANSQHTVQIVVVNYRTPELVIDCLHSLEEHIIQGGIRVSLVDNKSGDSSVPILKAAIAENGWESWVDLIVLETNGGFAFGNNAAIREAIQANGDIDFFWLLNPDTVVRRNALAPLVKRLESNSEIGVTGSRLEDPDATPQRSAFRFPTVFSELDTGLRLGVVSKLLDEFVVAPPTEDHAFETDWVGGASMLIRREVFEEIGLLDDGFFMYFEEVDFCLRAKRAGWTCWYEPASRVVHLVGQASGVTGKRRKLKRRPTYWFDSRRRYFVKNHGRVYTAVADLVWATSYSLWCLRWFFQRQKHNDPPRFLFDFIRNSVLFKGAAI